MIFQDPYDTLNPRFTVRSTLLEPLAIHKIGSSQSEREETACKMLKLVSIEPSEYLDKYPDKLSGGERQRVAISRAMILRPELVVADEPTSMLDVSLRCGLLELMEKLRADYNMGFLFITHDIALARHFCDLLLVLDKGCLIEQGDSDQVVFQPVQEYTKQLINAAKEPELMAKPLVLSV